MKRFLTLVAVVVAARMAINHSEQIGEDLLVGWDYALVAWGWLAIVWGWLVAAGAGMLVSVAMTAALMFTWLVGTELFGRRKIDDWPDWLLGVAAALALIGGEALGVWRYVVEPNGFFTGFLGRVAMWSAIAGVVPVALDRMFGRSGSTIGSVRAGPDDGGWHQEEGEAPPPVGRSSVKKRRSTGKYYLTPDGRITRKKPPEAMADVVVDLDVKPRR